MHQAPHAERVEFYKYASAYTHFAQSQDILVDLRDNGDGYKPWMVNALWTAFFVTYGKPFRQKEPKAKGGIVKPSLRLDDTIIPKEFLTIHRTALFTRDKQWAHTDHDSFLDLDGYPLTTIRAWVLDDRKVHVQIKGIHPNAKQLLQYIELITCLKKKTDYRQMKIWKRWYKNFDDMMPGTAWDLNAAESPNDVFVKLDTTTGRPDNSP
jgi:hypothetical protein